MIDILRDIQLTDDMFEMQDLVVSIAAQRSVMLLKLKRMHEERKIVEVSTQFKNNLNKTQLAYDIQALQIKKINIHILRLKTSHKLKRVDTRRLDHISRLDATISKIKTVTKEIVGFDKYLEIMKEVGCRENHD